MNSKHLILMTLLCVLSACTSHRVEVQSIKPDIDWNQETPASIKARIASSAQQLKILSAFFSLSMNPPPKNMMSSISGVITIDNRLAQPKVRIRAFHLFGSTLFDMVNTDITKIYVPRKNTMYIDTKQEQTRDNRGPQTIFANMMLEPAGIIIKDGQGLTISNDAVILYLEDGWLVLDKKSGLITSRHKGDLDITYSAYRQLADKTLIPTEISITTPDDSFAANCTLSQVTTLESLPETFFDLAEYKPETIKDLQEMQE